MAIAWANQCTGLLENFFFSVEQVFEEEGSLAKEETEQKKLKYHTLTARFPATGWKSSDTTPLVLVIKASTTSEWSAS